MARTTVFIVAGKVGFPIDMLRHDSCFPDTSLDSAMIEERGLREVTLLHTNLDNRLWEPTEGRWNSFMWKVVDVRTV